MNGANLLAHFDRLADTPDAVARLRRFILDLAVRGKLVEQSSDDEPASILLDKVAIEWIRLQEEGISQRGRSIPVLGENDRPFSLPISWKFVCLGDVLQMINGRAFKPTEWLDKGLPIIRIQNLNNPTAPFNYCDPSTVEERHRIRNGDLLISWSGTPGTSFGAFIWQRGDGALNQHIFRCMQVGGAYDPRFLQLAINSQLDVLIAQAKGGAGLRHVTKGALERLVLVLPPLGEQHRIVAKFDGIMALCDQLEAAQQERGYCRDRLASASLQRLSLPSNSNTPAGHHEYVHFLLQHLPLLTVRTAHIKALRLALLNKAVRGGFSEGASWTLTPQPLRTVATLQNGYAFKSEWFTPDGVRLLRNINVSHDVLDWTDAVYLPATRVDEFQRFQLREGDIVLSLDRPFIATGTKVARLRPSDLPCLLLQRVGRFVLQADLLAADYLFLWIQSPHFNDQVNPGRSNGVPHISSKQVEAAEIYLPPLEEQHHIVGKVKELMAICDQLEAQVARTQIDSRKLLDMMLDQALGITRDSSKSLFERNPSNVPMTGHKQEKAPRYMTKNSTMTADQLIECIDDLGDLATPERLLRHAGLSEDVEFFYDLLRVARNSGAVIAPLGTTAAIRRQSNAN